MQRNPTAMHGKVGYLDRRYSREVDLVREGIWLRPGAGGIPRFSRKKNRVVKDHFNLN
jgi:hypothetical protein